MGRAATASDLDAVSRCLTSAFFDDPVWGEWAFPDRITRAGPLYRLLGAWAAAGLRHPWVRMTDDAEAVAVWIPPGQPEMTPAEEAQFGSLARELMGTRTRELNDLL